MRIRPAARNSLTAFRQSAVALVVLLIAALHILAARRNAVGIYNDDAANVLLSRSLRNGSYSFPGGLGAPEEFLPAFPLLLAVPTMLVEPNWNLLRAVPLAFAGLCLFLTWRLARRFLSPEAAAVAVLLTALNPVMIDFAGLVMPYFPYLALTLALIDGAGAAHDWRSFLWLAAGAGLAPLLRPQGAVLIGCLALAQWRRGGLKRGGAFLSLALLPALAWTLRNHLRAGSSRDYVDTWRIGLAALGNAPILERASRVLSMMFGGPFLFIPGTTAIQAVFAALALGLALIGALQLRNKLEDARILVLASYVAGLIGLHMTWQWIDARYLIPFVPLLWILIISATTKLLAGNRALKGALLAIFIGLPLTFDLPLARAGLRGTAPIQPETMAWIRENVPPSARMSSAMNYSIALLTGRECTGQNVVTHAGLWLAAALNFHVDYLHVVLPGPGDGFELTGFPDGYQPAFCRWLDTRPEAERVYRNPVEGSVVYRLRGTEGKTAARTGS
jgi:hypothetical protein